MFYFLLTPFITYNFILIAAAAVPALFLMVKVARSDRLEREDPALLRILIRAGILSSLLALVEERVLSYILNSSIPQDDPLYNVILYFGIVAIAEESSKYIFLKSRTWKSPEFNCRYDGVVYSVFVSLGFALWENISYVLSYGFTTALVRAVTAIPGHACFGVFMGVFYGMAKKYDNLGRAAASRAARFCALLFPMLLHGAYDYIASSAETALGYYFIPFVLIMFVISYALVSRQSKTDEYIG